MAKHLLFSHTAGGNIKCYNCFVKNIVPVSLKVKYAPTVWSIHSIPRYKSKKMYVHIKTCLNDQNIHSNFISNIPKLGQPDVHQQLNE